MGPEHWSLLISGLATATAVLSLIFNNRRPKVKARFKAENRRFVLTVTNYGPGVVACAAILRKRRKSGFFNKLLRRNRLDPPLDNRYTTNRNREREEPFPHRLELAEVWELEWEPHLVKSILDPDPSRLGASDTFGRGHWVPRKQLRKAKEEFRRIKDAERESFNR